MNVALSIPEKLEYIGCLNIGESGAVETVTVAIKVASRQAVPSAPGNEDDDIDGCDVEVEVPTADEDLPPAEGGVA